MNDSRPIRIGILGAAAIGPMGLIHPARSVPETQVVGVAARDPERARAYAKKHRLPRVFESYEALLADPDIDAVYNPLPNSLHAEWTIRALKAGKHVLCEKPFSSNAQEAERMAQAATETGMVLSEAFHFRYHPLPTRIKAILQMIFAFNTIWRVARRWTLAATGSVCYVSWQTQNQKSPARRLG